MLNNEVFAGDKKVGQSILTKYEARFTSWAVPKIPPWIETYHLTLASIPISLIIVLAGFMARFEIEWLWLMSFMIFVQWVTDNLDGAVGRARNTGLIKWGYYMDHFLDYLFLCAILIGYMFMVPDSTKFVHFFVLAMFGAFMVNSYLSFATTNQFKFAYFGIGPTEIRIVFILINTLLILFGKTYLSSSLPFVFGLSVLGLCLVVYRTQKEIWAMDMEVKKKMDVKVMNKSSVQKDEGVI